MSVITITGENFGTSLELCEVRVNDQLQATILSVENTQIVAELPTVQGIDVSIMVFINMQASEASTYHCFKPVIIKVFFETEIGSENTIGMHPYVTIFKCV